MRDPEVDGRARPTGRAAVMDAVLDAATELIAERGPDAVTVRAIGLDTMPLEQRDTAIDGFITSVMLARPADRDPGAGGT